MGDEVTLEPDPQHRRRSAVFPHLESEPERTLNRPYTGNRIERIELTVTPQVKAQWEQHARNCHVTLPLFIQTATELLIRQITGTDG